MLAVPARRILSGLTLRQTQPSPRSSPVRRKHSTKHAAPSSWEQEGSCVGRKLTSPAHAPHPQAVPKNQGEGVRAPPPLSSSRISHDERSLSGLIRAGQSTHEPLYVALLATAAGSQTGQSQQTQRGRGRLGNSSCKSLTVQAKRVVLGHSRIKNVYLVDITRIHIHARILFLTCSPLQSRTEPVQFRNRSIIKPHRQIHGRLRSVCV